MSTSSATFQQPIISSSDNNSNMSSFWTKFKTRSKYYVPILKWFPRYDSRKNLIDDVLAGVTVAFLLIPQSLSYASGLAKLEPVYGLYSAFFPIMIYGILGTSRQLAVGPEALVSLLVGNAISQTASQTATMEDYVGIATSLSLMVGLITFALGLTRLGFLDSVLSRALLRGFITAVACVILIEQLPTLLGLPPIEPSDGRHRGEDEISESPFAKLVLTFEHLHHTNWVTLLISTFSVIFLLGFSRFKHFVASRIEKASLISRPIRLGSSNWPSPNLFSPHSHDEYGSSVHGVYESFPAAGYAHSDSPSEHVDRFSHLPVYFRFLFFIPDILIVVACTIIISLALHLNETHNVDILGDAALQNGFKLPKAPTLSKMRFNNLLTSAILISILGFVESIAATKQYASKYHYPVSANRELVAYGSINLLGSLMNCFPAFASIARTQVNDAAGSKTQLAGMITGIMILFTILFLLPIFYYLPKAVMASIVLVAAVGLLEFEDVVFMWKIRAWVDMALMLSTFLITIFWSVESGTLISIGLSLILVVKHTTAPKISILGKVVEGQDGDGGVGETNDSHMQNPSSSAIQPKIKYKPLHEIFQNPDEQQPSKEDLEILIVKIEESLFFANTGQLKDRLRRAEVYGGWLHIHPSEEERRPLASADKRKRVNERKAFGKRPLLAEPEFYPAAINPQPQRFESEKYPNGFSKFDKMDVSDVEDSVADPLDIASSSSEPPILRAVIFDIENMPFIDATAIQILIEITKEYYKRGVEVCFVKLRENNKSIFLRSGLLGEFVGSDHFFRKIGDAMRFLREKWHWEENLSQPGRPISENPGLPEASSYSSYSVL